MSTDIAIFNGLKVKHNRYGAGKVVSVDGAKLTISFKGDTQDSRVFSFPVVMQHMKVTSKKLSSDTKEAILQVTKDAIDEANRKEIERKKEIEKRALAIAQSVKKLDGASLRFALVPYNLSGTCNEDQLRSNTRATSKLPCCYLDCGNNGGSFAKRVQDIRYASINGEFICPMHLLRTEGRLTFFKKNVDLEPEQYIALVAKVPVNKRGKCYYTVVGLGVVESVSTVPAEEVVKQSGSVVSKDKLPKVCTEVYLYADSMLLFNSEQVGQIGDSLSYRIKFNNLPVQSLSPKEAFNFISELSSILGDESDSSEFQSILNDFKQLCLDRYMETFSKVNQNEENIV